MDKEKFYIDLTTGRRIFDTSRQSEWTKEEWQDWIGEPEAYQGLSFDLLEDNILHLKVSTVYYNEANNHMYVIFEVNNNYGHDILLETGHWKVDDMLFEMPAMLPVHIKVREIKANIEGNVPYMFMQRSIYMEFKMYEARPKKLLRNLAFDVKVYHS